MMKKLLVVFTCCALLVGCKKANQNQKQSDKHVGSGHAKTKVSQKKATQKLQKPSLVLSGKMLAKGTPTTDATVCKIHLKVSGMVCAVGCAPKVRTTLKGVKGISEAFVSYKTKTAVIDAKGNICAGTKTQGMIDKAFKKESYKCKIAKIEIFSKATKKIPNKQKS